MGIGDLAIGGAMSSGALLFGREEEQGCVEEASIRRGSERNTEIANGSLDWANCGQLATVKKPGLDR